MGSEEEPKRLVTIHKAIAHCRAAPFERVRRRGPARPRPPASFELGPWPAPHGLDGKQARRFLPNSVRHYRDRRRSQRELSQEHTPAIAGSFALESPA